MLRTLIIAGVIGVFAFALCFVGISTWRSSQQNQYANAKPSAQNAAEKGGNSTPVVGTEERPEDAIARYNLWLMVFTGVLAVVGLVQIGFLISADRIAEQTAAAAYHSA